MVIMRSNMKKLFLSILLILSLVGLGWTATYYVRTDGHDTNCNGTANVADSAGVRPACAYLTVAKINATALAPGDFVKFKDDQGPWREQILVPNTGTVGNQITFGRTGDGTAKPKIYGSTAVITWTDTEIPGAVADLVDENFEGTGYEETWTETVGAGSGVNEDSTAVARPVGGSAQVLQIDKVDPNYNAKTVRDLGSALAITYASVWAYVTAEGLGSDESLIVMHGEDASANKAWYIKFHQKATGKYDYQMRVYSGGAWVAAASSAEVLLDTWHKLEMKYDVTNDAYEFRVDSASVVSAALTDAHRAGVRYITLGDAETAKTVTMYLDVCQVSSTGYVTSAVALPAGSWKAALAALPDAVYFVAPETGVVSWGNKETVLSNVNAEYDWYFDTSGYLVVYAASTPDTRYASVEAPVRASCIDANVKNYITVSGLELAYSKDYGVKVFLQAGWIVDGVTIHHIGAKNEALAEGVFIRGASNTIQNSTIHNVGNHGINLSADTGQTVTGTIIQDNTLYDNYHTDIDLQCNHGASSNHIIRRNYLYNTASFDYSLANGGIYVLGEHGVDISGVQIYYNKFWQKAGTAIVIRDQVPGAFIYNNTISGTLSGSAQTAHGIDVFTLGSFFPSATVLKNNICMDVRNICFQVTDVGYVGSCDNNLWYQSAGGAAVYANIAATAYHSNDQAAYIAATGWDTIGKWEDPLFVSTTDLHLQKRSPAIDAGGAVGLATDYSGRQIQLTPDIGAYETESRRKKSN
jgi:hypothetical protein